MLQFNSFHWLITNIIFHHSPLYTLQSKKERVLFRFRSVGGITSQTMSNSLKILMFFFTAAGSFAVSVSSSFCYLSNNSRGKGNKSIFSIIAWFIYLFIYLPPVSLPSVLTTEVKRWEYNGITKVICMNEPRDRIMTLSLIRSVPVNL